MAKAGKRAHYSVHFMNSIQFGRPLLLDSTLKVWLVTRAEVHPTVSGYKLDGPVFTYDALKPRKGAPPLTTTVPMTVFDIEGRRGYWDVWDDRGAPVPREFDVKRTHAQLEGVGYHVFTASYFTRHIVERKNIAAAHRWLETASGFDTSAIETGVRLKTSRAPMTFEQLASELRCNVVAARVAALRLWKRGKVHLPVADQLICHPDFRVAGRTS